MTPRPLDLDVVHVRLRKIRELLADLESIGDVTEPRLLDDAVSRHAVERILTAIVDLAVAAASHVIAARRHESPLTYADAFIALGEIGAIEASLARELATSARMRNVLVHQYLEIDLGYVVEGATRAPAAYRAFTVQLLRYVEPD
jgi:uncharacterized protein YutE (UPF0331/DUF86 family)